MISALRTRAKSERRGVTVGRHMGMQVRFLRARSHGTCGCLICRTRLNFDDTAS